MNILAIDTSSNFLSIALWRDGEVFSHHKPSIQNQASLIYSAVDEVLRLSKIKLCDCDAIAFGKGPGSFTGVRIAAACVQGFAIGCNLPVIPISNLQALAQQALSAIHFSNFSKSDENSIQVLTAIDARMQEVYASWHKINETEILTSSEEVLISPTNLDFLQEAQDFILIGNADLYLEQMPMALREKMQQVIQTQVDAIAIAQLGAKIFAQKGGEPAEQALPIYLRSAVV